MSIVVEVHGMAAATDWNVEGTLEPVACFVLVSTFDPAYASLPPEKIILPVSAFPLADNLIGKAVQDFGTAISGKDARLGLG